MPLSPLGRILQPSIGGYQPNVPLNAQAARLGAKGKAFLQAMAGEFGALEGKYGLPAGLLSSVAATESGGDPFAVSKGAKGPFQFMDGTAKDLGLKGMDVYDPHKSADAAARYLRYLLDATGGDLEKTLAPITGGSETSRRKAWITCRRKLAITSQSHGRNAPRRRYGRRPRDAGQAGGVISFMAPKSPPRPRTWNSLPATSKSTATTVSCFWLATQDNNSCRFL
jgi:soluble lytic murein transglycosylase-like protein